MIKNNIKYKVVALFLAWGVVGCTKLDENLNSTLTNQQTADALGASGTGLLLKTAYNDLATPFNDVEQLINLTGNASDESLVPTRGGDWDDNGKWRATHAHTWNADLAACLLTFNSLNKINFDATNVLAFNPTPVQAAEARFIRAYALYNLLDLFGQYPFRNPGDNLLNAPEVKSGAAAIDFIISELNAILSTVPAASANINFRANPDAVRMLLMRCYLNKGAFANRAAPAFADADMQQVITLGNAIISSGRYSYTPNFFDNFTPDNQTKTKEAIWAYDNTSGVSAASLDVKSFWFRTLHYNSFDPKAPNAGWNGFSTVAEFYNSFGIAGTPTQTPTDTLLDQRIGGRFKPGITDVPGSGLRPGLLIGQQFDHLGNKKHYRNWVAADGPNAKLLSFTPNIAPNMIETTPGILETTGIRVMKYSPDFPQYDGAAGNDVIIFRYPDVVLMVAEAMMRKATPDNAGALTLVNALRAARSAAPLPSMTLNSTTNTYAPLTLLAERGREMYWEYVRRTDLIRFKMFTVSWPYKAADAEKNLVFPIPSQALAANPNLKQNPGY
ncbi:MAG: RagB/SusD family nutrient uptake outer membrane protein [Bacteroidetes bacterium]|nr:MAG: RagB/SusD family nutrient uptake outer membrane protein [Bacteroidota bacterium]